MLKPGNTRGSPVFSKKMEALGYIYDYTTHEGLRDTSSVWNKILVENKQKNRVSSVGTMKTIILEVQSPKEALIVTR